MFSFEAPHRGNSSEYTQYTIFNVKKKITLNYLKSAALYFFLGIQERIRNGHGKRAIIVRATEGLLSLFTYKTNCSYLQIKSNQIYFGIPLSAKIQYETIGKEKS